MSTAAALISFAQTYCMIGAFVALAFLTIGIDRIDEDARGAYAFRPLLIPAVLLIWPLVLWRWFREETGQARWQGRHSPPRAAHGVAALVIGAAICLTLLASVLIHQTWPAEAPAVQLSGPESVQ